MSKPTSGPANGGPPRSQWRLLSLLIAMSGVGSMSLNVLVPAVPGLVATFATDAASVQLTVSLYLMGLAVAQLVFGPLSDRFGRRPVTMAGLALATLASTAAIFVSTIGGLVIARVVQSLGASTGQTMSRAIIRDLYARERAASMMGLVTSVVVLMPMMAPLVGGILDTLFGWKSIFIFVALFTGAIFLWAARELPETRKLSPTPGDSGSLIADLKALAVSPQFFGYALCVGLGCAPFFSFLGAAPHVTVTILGRTSAEYGAWFFLPAFGFMAGNFAVSRLSGRFTIDTLIWWGIAIMIIGLLINTAAYLAFPGWEMAAIFLPQIVVGVGNGLMLPTAIAGAVSIRPHVAGTASGVIGFIQMTIGAIAAQTAGYLIANASSAMPMLLHMLFFGVATGIAVFVLVRRV